jgi:hypothetical protein
MLGRKIRSPFERIPLVSRTEKSYLVMASDAISLSVLRLLSASSGPSQRGLASLHSASLGKINRSSRAPITHGFVESENYWKSSHKLVYSYVLTPAGVARKAELMGPFLARKARESEALRLELGSSKQESDPLAVAARTTSPAMGEQ